mmetsp:Transcript_12609/g.24616  ORF Transcript_12609/g.24616 Transcript_12609/m.24616 type:complete len:88 (-) Transcript_12609:675-938(-)
MLCIDPTLLDYKCGLWLNDSLSLVMRINAGKDFDSDLFHLQIVTFLLFPPRTHCFTSSRAYTDDPAGSASIKLFTTSAGAYAKIVAG